MNVRRLRVIKKAADRVLMCTQRYLGLCNNNLLKFFCSSHELSTHFRIVPKIIVVLESENILNNF